MSVSDLMTGLMVIFLFIAVAYMERVEDNQSVLTKYIDTKNNLHAKLVDEFKGDTLKWKMAIGKDLTMKFKDPTVLFEQGKWDITPQFKTILQDFLPRYFDILLRDSLRNNINEIRIEGHTDNVPYPSIDSDPYVANVILSQRRALSVLRFFRSMPIFKTYTPEQQKLLEYWFTCNGLSYGKALDKNGRYIQLSKQPIDMEISRRVEFRIVTSGDENAI